MVGEMTKVMARIHLGAGIVHHVRTELAGVDGGAVQIHMPGLARALGVHRSSLHKALDRLLSAGELEELEGDPAHRTVRPITPLRSEPTDG